MSRVAIFGGTFNPPHLGHMAMLDFLKELSYDKIIIMPAFDPPHKKSAVATPTQRLEMCRLAFSSKDNVEISDLEISLGGKSYTVNTLEALRKMGIQNPSLVIGGDSFVDFHKWYRYEDILKLAELVVYRRGNIENSALLKAKVLLEKKGGNITLLDFVPPDISSTMVRECIKNNKKAKGLVAQNILDYITSQGLYKGDYMEPEFGGIAVKYREEYDEYVKLLKDRLTEKRFFHSLAVAKEAVRLAEKYGSDTKKAFFAGLMHDVCKDMPQKEQLKMFKQFDIILDSISESAPKLWHAVLGATYLEEVLKVEDKEIINAVRYHTTARANMSLLEKLIYLADFTSEDRDYSGVDEMRIAVDVSLEKAMQEALEFSVEDLKAKGSPVHRDTLDAYLEIKNN